MKFEMDLDYFNYFVQNYTCENGNTARFIIPEDATEDDLKGIREMFDVALERHFKVIMRDKRDI